MLGADGFSARAESGPGAAGTLGAFGAALFSAAAESMPGAGGAGGVPGGVDAPGTLGRLGVGGAGICAEFMPGAAGAVGTAGEAGAPGTPGTADFSAGAGGVLGAAGAAGTPGAVGAPGAAGVSAAAECTFGEEGAAGALGVAGAADAAVDPPSGGVVDFSGPFFFGAMLSSRRFGSTRNSFWRGAGNWSSTSTLSRSRTATSRTSGLGPSESCVSALTPPSNMVVQNGQAVAISSAPVSMAWPVRNSLTRWPMSSSMNMRAPPAPQQKASLRDLSISRSSMPVAPSSSRGGSKTWL